MFQSSLKPVQLNTTMLLITCGTERRYFDHAYSCLNFYYV